MPNDDHSDDHSDARTETRSPAARKLLFFDQRSAKQLLEVYVKRSLSLNDAGGLRKQRLKTRKLVTVTSGGAQARRASSDSSAYRLSIENVLKTKDSTTPPQSNGTARIPEPARKSVLRAFLNWFSRKRSETRPEDPSSKPENHSLERRAGETSRTVRKKHSFRTLSFRNPDQTDSQKKNTPLTPEDVVRLPNAVSVEPTSVYLEKVSEELERIVQEVKSPDGEAAVDLSVAVVEDSEQGSATDDAVERMISLLKQQGDAIDEKIKRNSSVHSFLQRLSYSSFQQLADRYLAQISPPANQVNHTAPELVQLAFTLDFTAKVAGLSNQAVSRIMGFGNQYLQDRFTQICSAHKQVEGDAEGQCCSDPE